MKDSDNSNFAFSDHMQNLREMFSAARETIIMDHLANLGETYDSPEDIEYAVNDFSSQLEKLVASMKAIAWMEENIGPLLDEHGISNTPDSSIKRKADDLRVVHIQVTQGMINQSLLTLTQPKKEGIISESETFTITLPWGQQFTAEIKQPGNRLSERGLISQFYSKAKVKEGDHVQLDEYEHGRWRLTKSERRYADFIFENLNLEKDKR